MKRVGWCRGWDGKVKGGRRRDRRADGEQGRERERERKKEEEREGLKERGEVSRATFSAIPTPTSIVVVLEIS